MEKIILIVLLLISVKTNAQSPKEIEMFDLINELRTNPKSFIEIIENYEKSITNFSFKQNGKPINILVETKKLKIFLKSVKPVNKLEFSNEIYTVTKTHANYLDSLKILSHTGKNGLTLRKRLPNITVGENVGNNLTPIQSVISFLLDLSDKDKGHRKNLLNPIWTKVSIGNSGTYWVQNFIN